MQACSRRAAGRRRGNRKTVRLIPLMTVSCAETETETDQPPATVKREELHTVSTGGGDSY